MKGNLFSRAPVVQKSVRLCFQICRLISSHADGTPFASYTPD